MDQDKRDQDKRDPSKKIKNLISKKRICLQCLEEVESQLTCSKCKTAFYCGRSCQVKHWSVHKNNCIDSSSESTSEALELKARNFFHQGNFLRAEKSYKKLRNKLRSDVGDNEASTLRAIDYLALSIEKQGRYSEAEKLHRYCLERRKALLGDDHSDTLDTIMGLAVAIDGQGRYKEGEELLRLLLPKREALLGGMELFFQGIKLFSQGENNFLLYIIIMYIIILYIIIIILEVCTLILSVRWQIYQKTWLINQNLLKL